MSPNKKAPHLQPARGAIPIQALREGKLEHVNQLLAEKKAVLQTISSGGRSRVFIIPVQEKES